MVIISGVPIFRIFTVYLILDGRCRLDEAKEILDGLLTFVKIAEPHKGSPERP